MCHYRLPTCHDWIQIVDTSLFPRWKKFNITLIISEPCTSVCESWHMTAKSFSPLKLVSAFFPLSFMSLLLYLSHPNLDHSVYYCTQFVYCSVVVATRPILVFLFFFSIENHSSRSQTQECLSIRGSQKVVWVPSKVSP